MKTKIKAIIKQVEDLQRSIFELKPEAINVRKKNIKAEKACLEFKDIVTDVLQAQIIEEEFTSK